MIKLHQGEEIYISQRKHWFALAAESAGLVAAAIVPFFVMWLMMAGEGTKEHVTGNIALIIFGVAAWELALWVIFFILWTNYYLNLLVVTNVRVIDIEQHGLFARDMADMRLDRIQDVKVEVMGIVASLLDFGDVHIQSAGASREVVAPRIRDPYKVRDAIVKAQHDKLSKRYNHPSQTHQQPQNRQHVEHYPPPHQQQHQKPQHSEHYSEPRKGHPHSPHNAAKKRSRRHSKRKNNHQ